MAKQSKAAKKAIESFNKNVLASHAKLIEEILQLRPSWSRGKLQAVGKTYGFPSEPGLHDILTSVRAADALAREFSTTDQIAG